MFVVKVPGINGLGKTDGCEKTGNAILNSLKEDFINEQGKIVDTRFFDLEELRLDNSDLEMANKLIYENSLKFFETKPKIVFLGGDHSVSYSIVRGFLEHCQKNERVSQAHSASSNICQSKEPCLIVFDAHPDCMKPMKEPTHEEWLRALVEAGFPAENILLVGVRNVDVEELSFLKQHKINVMSINRFLEDLPDACDAVMEFSNNKELYVSIDIDVIDPVFAPSTGYKEPGGFTSRQFLYLIQRINKIKNLRAVDIVEIDAKNDKDGLTVKLGAKILNELI